MSLHLYLIQQLLEKGRLKGLKKSPGFPGLFSLLNLCLFEDYVLPDNRIVLFQFKLLRLLTWVFLSNVEKTSVSGAEQLNFCNI
jgi:hypothetical protein